MTDTDKLIERLRDRAKGELEIAENNRSVADALAPQMEAFKAKTEWNNFAVRMFTDHDRCAKNDMKLADDWTAAADALSAQQKRIDELMLFIATDVSRACGTLSAYKNQLPILDDDPQDWIERICKHLSKEGERLKEGIDAALRTLQGDHGNTDNLIDPAQKHRDEIIAARQASRLDALYEVKDLVKPIGLEPSVDPSNPGDVAEHAAWVADNTAYLAINKLIDIEVCK